MSFLIEPPRERGSIEIMSKKWNTWTGSEPPRERGSIEIEKAWELFDIVTEPPRERGSIEMFLIPGRTTPR